MCKYFTLASHDGNNATVSLCQSEDCTTCEMFVWPCGACVSIPNRKPSSGYKSRSYFRVDCGTINGVCPDGAPE